ncbi:hypothetical protein M8J75_007167 [Diaphorina citri]|nr:hypothetical protein M8J75_007167 [Diaphorina citri]
MSSSVAPINECKVQIHTGNILNLTDLKLQTADREFAESIRLTLEEKYGKDLDEFEEDIVKPKTPNIVEINRGSPFATVSPGDIQNSRTSVKIFVKSCEVQYLQQAVANILKYLEGQAVDSVVLAYNTSSSKEKSPEQLLSELETLWATLETLVEEKKISRIGLSDLHEDIFIQFYNRAKVKPGIIQINLSSCCVVPPVLQEFAKSKEIQLLTHSDPIDILYQAPVMDLFKNKTVSLSWAVKYQTHVVCRGVLNYDHDVQELIRHNVQHYIQSGNLEVIPNGQNMQVPSRVANQRRIVYYATLPEIVRRPNPGVQESPYWTNYLLPRELSGSSNEENEVMKVHSTILDVRDPGRILIPVKIISPQQQQASDPIQTRSDNIQPAPYYAEPYPTRHNRYPTLESTRAPLRPVNYHPSHSHPNNIPTPTPKSIEIYSPKSYELNGKRYGIYHIPSLSDNSVRSLYDNSRHENNKFTNYEKFYNAPGTFDKFYSGDLSLEKISPISSDYVENEMDLDWQLGANSRQQHSYSLKIMPQSVTYLPRNVLKTLDPATSGSYSKDVIKQSTHATMHSVNVKVESNSSSDSNSMKEDTSSRSSSMNGTLETPAVVEIHQKNSSVNYENKSN